MIINKIGNISSANYLLFFAQNESIPIQSYGRFIIKPSNTNRHVIIVGMSLLLCNIEIYFYSATCRYRLSVVILAYSMPILIIKPIESCMYFSHIWDLPDLLYLN